MNEISADPKRDAILGSAMTAFASYGFRKTSMDDIARGAGMSRPAVYMHFRNKEDILRSLVEMTYLEAADGVRAALEADGSVAMRLRNALLAQAGRITELLLKSPHGMELMDSGADVAMDLVEAGEARLSDLYADWLAAEMSAGRVDLLKSPDHVAQTLTAAMKGLKKRGADLAEYQARVETLAVLVGAGLTRG